MINGNFEDQAANYCKKPWCSDLGNDAITPWYEVNGKQVELDSSPSPWQAYSGNWSVDLSGNQPNVIAQNVNLTVGQEYLLTAWMSINPCGVSNKTGYVSATGSPQVEFSINATTWKPIRYSFIAKQVSTVITIGSTTLGTCGPVIDDVSLVATSATVYPTCSDVSGITFNPSTKIVVSSNAFSTQFTVVLNSKPSYPSVNVYLNSPGLTFSKSKLTFSNENWNIVI